MKNRRALCLSALLAIFVACTSDESGDSHSVSDNALGIPSGTYSVDKSHTYLTFSYLHQGLSYPLLRANGIDGELVLDPDAMENTSVSIVVDPASIRSNIDYFDKELASPKFFNVAKFPHIVFTADGYEAINESEGAMNGLVTIRGITKLLILTVKINGAMINPISSKPVIGISASGYLLRSDFGMDRFIPAVADRIDLKIEIEFEQGSNEEGTAAANLARSLTPNHDLPIPEEMAGNRS